MKVTRDYFMAELRLFREIMTTRANPIERIDLALYGLCHVYNALPSAECDDLPRSMFEATVCEWTRLSARLRAADELAEAAKKVRTRWTFDNNQRHTHTWHDKEDTCTEIEEALAAYDAARKEGR